MSALGCCGAAARNGAMAVVLLTIAWAYTALQPTPSRCFSDAPQAKRIRVADGRRIAYKEEGVPINEAQYKIVAIHGFSGSKDNPFPVSKELLMELEVYLLSLDRPGYGESDPNPRRSARSDAADIEALADEVGLCGRFYVIGISMGGLPAWSCIKHIPHRLAGVALVAPAVSYWWGSFPRKLSSEGYRKLPVPDRVAFWLARNAPPLLHLWMKQRFIKASAITAADPIVLSHQDARILSMVNERSATPQCSQREDSESTHRDLKVLFGHSDLDPMQLLNPFREGDNVSIHIWQGVEDRIVPVELQRFIAAKLPWVLYHECDDCGHLFVACPEWNERILKALLLNKA